MPGSIVRPHLGSQVKRIFQALQCIHFHGGIDLYIENQLKKAIEMAELWALKDSGSCKAYFRQ